MEFGVKTDKKIYTPTRSIQTRKQLVEKLEPNFLLFYDSLNGELENIKNIHILTSPGNYNLDYIFHSKLILFQFQLNVLPNINEFFRKCYSELNENDLFIGRVELMEGKHKQLKEKYPMFYYEFLIIVEFIFKRFLPRIPVTGKIYSKFHLLKKKILSKCEILGRLIYNGFNVIAEKEIDGELYFLCRKTGESSKINVNKGIIFKQRSTGKDGKTFNFYKLRTMHPYAEFVQDYLIEKNNLSSLGKIQNDFRVADWGKFLRRYWMDELPEIINFLKGDLRLFGVRPLSRGFFDMYPEDLQKERIKLKPGLIPPYYSDLPNSIQEVIESERRYLERREQNPLRTDVEYFVKAMKNILLKGARSA